MLAAAPPRPLDIPARIALLTKVGRSVITPDGYGAIDPDMRFARKKVPWRDGLRFGFLLFSQDSGLLGQLLLMMRQRNPSKFRDGFGADSDKLVTITTKPGPTGRDRPDGRSVRCDPVGGVDLWDTAGHWVGRFTWAGAQKEFQAAQNQLASREYLEPLLGFAKALDLTTERGLALLACRAIGSTGLWTRVGDPAGLARSRVIAAVGPIRGEERTKTALSAIGLRNLSEFQHMNGIKATGSMTAMTHAKLMGALRRLGSASPIPIPTRDQVMDAIVETGSTSQAMLQTIRSGKQFGDAPLAYGTPPVPTPTDM